MWGHQPPEDLRNCPDLYRNCCALFAIMFLVLELDIYSLSHHLCTIKIFYEILFREKLRAG